MALYRYEMQIISRGQGRNACNAAAYRAGLTITCERTGETFDYSKRGGVVAHFIQTRENEQDWVYDPSKLWNGVEWSEKRKDAQLLRELLITLPHELDHEQNKSWLQRHLNFFTDQGMVAHAAIHSPDKDGDQRNHHAHVMLSLREIEGEGFAKTKNRDWNKKDFLKSAREHCAEMQNAAFKEAGLDIRVDHRSYKEQGINREPGIHLGPAASAMERRGEKTRAGDHNREVEIWNRELEEARWQVSVLDAAIEKAEVDLVREREGAKRQREEERKRMRQPWIEELEPKERNFSAAAAWTQREEKRWFARRELLARGSEFWRQVDKDFAAEEREIRSSYNITALAKNYAEARQRLLELDTANGRFTGQHAQAQEKARSLEMNLKNAKYRQEEALERLNAEREELRQARENRAASLEERAAFLMNAKLNSQFDAQREAAELDRPEAAIEQDNTGQGIEDSHEREQDHAPERGHDDGYEMER